MDFEQATLEWLNNLADQGVLTTDTNLCILGWNRWLEQHSGYRASEVLGRPLFEVYPDLVWRRIDQRYQQVLNGQVAVFSQRLHRFLLPMAPGIEQTGLPYMQQSARIAPLIADEKIIGTITVIEDVTERVIREEELSRQIEGLEVLHDIGRAILSLDLPECLQQLVDRTAALLSAPSVTVLLLHDGSLQVASYAGQQVDDADIRANLPTCIANRVMVSGQSIWVPDFRTTASVTPLQPTSRCGIGVGLVVDERVIGVLLIEAPQPQKFDKAHFMQANTLAIQAAIGIHNAQLYEDAQKAILARDAFLSIASHELKTPLTSLLGYAQVMQRRVAREQSISPRDQKTLQALVAQTERLTKMVDSLLDISRMKMGQLSIERRPLDLCTLARRVVDEFQLIIERHTIELIAPEEALIIEGDELRLAQVLQNLLQNAVKYSPAGGPILVQIARYDRKVCLSVADQGIGIPQEALAQLFTRFYRVHDAQSQHISGMGIGLYVVKEVVDLHGGEVAVESVAGAGSTFLIYLPLADEAIT
jgi:signal transduction histidine kinase